MINRFLKSLKGYRSNENIGILELRNIIQTNQNCILLDVRSPQEFMEGHLNRSYKYSVI